MKMTICDRCGNPVNKSETKKDKSLPDLINEAYNNLMGIKEEELPRVMLGEEEIDLCEECRKDLQNWVKVKTFDFDFWLRKEEQQDEN